MAAQEADHRLKFTNDLLTGIRVVKAYAWEKAFMRVIGETRAKELLFIRRHAYWNMLGMMCVYMQIPALMQMIVYFVFVASGGEFSAARIFTVIQLSIVAAVIESASERFDWRGPTPVCRGSHWRPSPVTRAGKPCR